MALINVMAPMTNVQIVPFAGCENDIGVIIETKIRRCCDATTNESCIEYLVRYDFKACTNCSKQETWFCASELVELP